MKKLLLLIVGTLLWTASLFAQDKDHIQPKLHSPFASYGMSWTPNSDLTYSGEVGTWGTKSPTSFSITFDAARNVLKGGTDTNPLFTKWVGVKAYYTIFEREKICYMLYGKQAVQLNNTQTTLLEFGFNPNYTLSKHLLLGFTIGNQALQNSQWNLFSSLGVVYLFQP